MIIDFFMEDPLSYVVVILFAYSKTILQSSPNREQSKEMLLVKECILILSLCLCINGLHVHSSSSRPMINFKMMMDESIKKKKTIIRPKSQGFGTSSSSSTREITNINNKNPLFKYTGSIRPGNISPQRIVTDASIVVPDYAVDGKPKKNKQSLLPWIIEVKTAADIEKMKQAGKVARQVLDIAGSYIQPGVTTDFIDQIVHEENVKRGAYPSPLNYHGFPKSCCTSVRSVFYIDLCILSYHYGQSYI